MRIGPEYFWWCEGWLFLIELFRESELICGRLLWICIYTIRVDQKLPVFGKARMMIAIKKSRATPSIRARVPESVYEITSSIILPSLPHSHFVWSS